MNVSFHALAADLYRSDDGVMVRPVIREEGPGDAAGIRAVTRAAFDTDAEADLVDALRRDPHWIPGLSLVAAAGPRILAHALLTRCRIGATAALALAPCSVDPEFQRLGLGTRVISAVLERAREMGESHVVVLGHSGYYPRFGFTRAAEAGVRLSLEVPEDALMVLSLDGAATPEGVVEYAHPFGV